MTKRAWVYVLKLQAGMWYVGTSTALQARICEHWAGQGAQWTAKHPPVSVVEAIECPDGNGLALEAAKTAEYCMRYCWKKVRGGSFTRCDAPGPPPWFDETGEKRKRVAKGKGSEQDEPTWKIGVAPPTGLDTNGKQDAVLCGVDTEWNPSDGQSTPREVEAGTSPMD